jgi:hypothetical protein
MEDILAILLAAAAVAAVVYAVKRFINWRNEQKRIREEYVAHAQAELARDMERRRQRIAERLSTSIPSKTVQKKVVETKPSYATSPTQSVQSSDDGFVNGLLAGMLIDSLTHKSGGSNPIDFPKVDNTPSWGLDDSDSRKSISSSMDTSSSWSSSSSDSYSSSSDSGPSSDW